MPQLANKTAQDKVVDGQNVVEIATHACMVCGNTGSVVVPKEQYREFSRDNSRHIQDVFPQLAPGQRELLISGIHEECFDSLFPDIDDDD